MILDATSGNTGIAYAMIGAARGYAVKLCLPANASPERKRILRAYGAELVLTDPLEGSDGAIREARRLVRRGPERYFYPDQYNEPGQLAGALRRHRRRRSGSRPAAGSRTSSPAWARAAPSWARRAGSKELNPAHPLHLVPAGLAAARPGGHEAHGHRHRAGDLRSGAGGRGPGGRDRGRHAMVRRLAREEGLLVGISAGAALVCALQVAASWSGRGRDDLSDGGDKYLSEAFWDD